MNSGYLRYVNGDPNSKDTDLRRGHWATPDGVPIAFVVPMGKGKTDVHLFGTFWGKGPERMTELLEKLRSAPGHTDRLVRKKIGEYRLYMRRKTWYEAIADKRIVAWANDCLSELEENYDCVDNVRVANSRKSSQIRRYMRQKDNGCCGSFDVKKTCPVDGQVYYLGFNYGH